MDFAPSRGLLHTVLDLPSILHMIHSDKKNYLLVNVKSCLRNKKTVITVISQCERAFIFFVKYNGLNMCD